MLMSMSKLEMSGEELRLLLLKLIKEKLKKSPSDKMVRADEVKTK